MVAAVPSMRQRLTAVLLLAALLAPGPLALHAAAMAETGRASHACCPEQIGARCHGQTIACCAPDGAPARSAALPASPSLSHTAGTQVHAGPAVLVFDAAAAARLAARLAHSADARLHAPPDPLFLKHLVLLV
jgi:hypothetical protein